MSIRKIGLLFKLHCYNHTRLSISSVISVGWRPLVAPFFRLLLWPAFVMMVVVVMPFFLDGAFAVVDVRNDHFWSVSVSFCSEGLVQGFFSSQGRVIVNGLETGFTACRFVEILPSLAVVAVETAIVGFWARRVEGCNCIAVGRGTMTVMFGISISETYKKNILNNWELKQLKQSLRFSVMLNCRCSVEKWSYKYLNRGKNNMLIKVE